VTRSTEGSAPAAERRPRVDKQRNRSHILDVAEQYFSEHGINGSLDAIAKRAGIGAGTLYRHFPTRDALLAALLLARDEELVAERDRIRKSGQDAAAALDAWLAALGRWATAFDGLPEPLRAAVGEERNPLALTCQGYVDDTDMFLSEAQHEGTARNDVRARDLFLAVLASAWVRGAAMADDATPQALESLTRHGWTSATNQ
jgi:AcrR family transcriptional regulator